MNKEDNHDLKELKDWLQVEITGIKTDIEVIRRGVYGDKENGVQGLIDYNKDQAERISKLELFSNKLKWLGAVIGLIAGAIGSQMGEWITKLK